MTWIRKQQVGSLAYTLFVIEPEGDGQRWRWCLNQADIKRTNVGKPIAMGFADTKEDAIRAVEETFEQRRGVSS